jgi:integrase
MGGMGIKYPLGRTGDSRGPPWFVAEPATGTEPKLLDQVRVAIRVRHVSHRAEVRRVLANLKGTLRLMECCRLRVKDVDFGTQQLVVRAGLSKPTTCGTFRRSFAPHLLEDGYDIRTVQELLGHKDVTPTQSCTHVLNRGPRGVTSAADRLLGG